MQIRDAPKKGLHDLRSFIRACNFYRRHIHNLTYSSAPLTDLIMKTNPLALDRQGRALFLGIEGEIFLYQPSGGTPP